MNETKSTLPAKIGGTEITRFNAMRHGVLSRYTVLPWEDAGEYGDLVAALTTEHAPCGPTEEHLVEELAGILWRKRRLRLAEAAAHRHGLKEALLHSQRTAKTAVVHISYRRFEDVGEAIRATQADTDEEVRDLEEDEAMTRRALDLLGSQRADLRGRAGDAARGYAAWWADRSPSTPTP